jgi:hypothetical protein
MKALIQKNTHVFYFFLCTVLLFSACRKADHGAPATDTERQERLAFKDLNDLYKTLGEIDKMNEKQIVEWEKSHNHASFRKHLYSLGIDDELSKAEQSLEQLPVSHQVLLNRNGELKVGDKIVWYHLGKKYYANDEAQLKKIQANPQQAEAKDKYTFQDVDVKEAPKTEGNYGVDFLDARYQKEFQAVAPGAGCRKYVHEIKGIVDGWYSYNDPGCGSGVTFYVKLLLTIKLEWKNCRRTNWHAAGEQRTVYWNLNKNIRLRNVVAPCTAWEVNLPFTGVEATGPFSTTSNIDVVLGSYAGNSNRTDMYWEVSFSGNIYHSIDGDVLTNAWDHRGNPFF